MAKAQVKKAAEDAKDDAGLNRKAVKKRLENMINLTPIADRIVVRRDAADEESEGGIIIPNMAQEKPRFGTVLAVGPGVLRQVPVTPVLADPLMTFKEGYVAPDPDRYPMQIAVGDRVIVSHYAESVQFGDEEVVVIRETEVLAIISA